MDASPAANEGATSRAGWPHWFREIRIVLLISVVTAVAANAGWFDGFETAWVDAILQLLPRRTAEHVSVVEITEEDYATRFHSTSPLDPKTLRGLLAAIARGRPRLVVIDLETRPGIIARVGSDPDEPAHWPPSVWARPDVLTGGEPPTEHDPSVLTGVAEFPIDRDGVIRRHERLIRPHEGAEPPSSSLPWAAVTTHCSLGGTEAVCNQIGREQPDEGLLMNFAGDRFDFERMTASAMLAASSGEGWSTERGPLFGKIVLLGGLYWAARDQHATPLGRTHGVYIVAQAIESELQGLGIRRTQEGTMFLMDVLCGLVIVLVHHQLKLPTAFRASVAGIPALVMLSSVVAFYSFSRWASFVPVCVGVLIHELYDTARRTNDPRAGHCPGQEPAA